MKDQNYIIWSWKESVGYTIQNSGHMVLKGVNWVHNNKIRSNGLERSQLSIQYKNQSYGLERSQMGTQCKNQVLWSWKESIGYTMIKLGDVVLKAVNWLNNTKISSYGLESSHTMIQWYNVHNDKIRSDGLEMSQLATQYKNQVIWSWNESIGYTMIKLCQMDLKGVNWLHNAKIRSYGLESSQLGTQW